MIYGQSVDFEVILGWHLQHNSYPPVSTIFLDACREAIENAAADRWDEEVDLPEGMQYLGENKVATHVLMNAFHLESFLTTENLDDN